MTNENPVDYSENPLREGLYYWNHNEFFPVYVYRDGDKWLKEYSDGKKELIKSNSDSMELFCVFDPEDYLLKLKINTQFVQSKLEQLLKQKEPISLH